MPLRRYLDCIDDFRIIDIETCQLLHAPIDIGQNLLDKVWYETTWLGMTLFTFANLGELCRHVSELYLNILPIRIKWGLIQTLATVK